MTWLLAALLDPTFWGLAWLAVADLVAWRAGRLWACARARA